MRKFKVGDKVAFKTDKKFTAVVVALRGGGRAMVALKDPLTGLPTGEKIVRNVSVFEKEV